MLGGGSWSKAKKKQKNILRKPTANPKVEPDAWPNSPTSWKVFQGPCQEQPQPMVKKGRFFNVTEHFQNLEGGFCNT